MNYARELDELLATYEDTAACYFVANEKPYSDTRALWRSVYALRQAVLKKIGCVQELQTTPAWQSVQPPGKYETITLAVYAHLFAHRERLLPTNDCEYRFFTGLGLRQRWVACVDEPCDPHVLAARLVRCVKWVQGEDAKMTLDQQEKLLPLLNSWCAPETPWTALPGTETLCTALFGSAWWHLYRPDLNTELDPDDPQPEGPWETWDFHYFTCYRLIQELRPPFLPGRLPGTAQIGAHPLPDLGL